MTKGNKDKDKREEDEEGEKEEESYYLLLFYPPQSTGTVTSGHLLVGLVVKASAYGAEDPGFESRLRRDFSGSSHTSDFKIGTPVATLPGAWHYKVGAGTGRPGVSIL